jgi:hypothetical protein
MTKDEALRMALEALEMYELETNSEFQRKAITAIKEALSQPEPVQVSPLEFVTMVMEKEHLVGKPIFWAQWPNKEKNT